MPELLQSLPLVGGLYQIENILLLYIFLTRRRSLLLHGAAWIAVTAAVYLLYPHLGFLKAGFYLREYALGCLYLIPRLLFFRETLPVKLFVFFMNFSLTQLTYLIFTYLDRLLSTRIPRFYVLAGLLLELAALPLVHRYAKPYLKNILAVMNRNNVVFVFFPILSFALLAYYGVLNSFVLSTFIPLVLSTLLILFSYYMISVSISTAKRGQELERISNSDSLTGVFNRRHMEQRIREEFNRYNETGMEFSLILIDIDFFKAVNDKYGHDCGDKLLVEIVRDIGGAVRQNDIVARWGGEEFLLLLPGTRGEQAAKLAERVRKAVEERRHEYGGLSLSATITLGAAVARPGDTLSALIKRADIALYRGKRKGRNLAILFDETDKPDA